MVLVHHPNLSSNVSQIPTNMAYRSGDPISLEIAARTVDQFIQVDNTNPTLLDYFKSLGDLPNQSGQHDPDYPGLTHLSRSLKSLSQVGPIKKVPLPAELVEQFGHMQSYCEMGIFPEIGRAWLTIDKDIFVWTYEEGGDLAYFDGLSETILSVGLVYPKTGIFQPHIQFLLCLATPIEIVLLGVSFTRKREDSPPYEEMHLLGEPLFTLATDNSHMVCITSSRSGRIFMGSKDGSVFELIYQAEDGWFRRRCRKVNHSSSSLSFLVPQFINMAFYEEDPIAQIEIDETRNILYARSEKGGIQVFDLGLDGLQMNKIISVPPSSVIDEIVHVARTGDRSAFKSIVHISIVELSESPYIHLVAFTQSGVRIYFTTTPMLQPARPYALKIVHVRFPPGHSVGGSPLQPNQVHHAHYRRGTALLVSSKGDNDLLWVISNDTFPTQPRLIELHTVVSLSGKAWALREIPSYPKLRSPPPIAADVGAIEPPVLVTQHSEPPQKFVLISPQGSHIVTKLQPWEQLSQLLIDHQGPDCDAVKSFFSLLRESQACAVSLILACSRQLHDKRVNDWASLAFFMYGGEGPAVQSMYGQQTPHSTALMQTGALQQSPWTSSPIGHSSALGPPLQASSPIQSSMNQTTAYKTLSWGSQGGQIDPMQQLQSTQYQMQQQQQQQHSMQQGGGIDGYFSAKHNGLYLYFGRIVRSIWNTRLVYDPSGLPPNSQPDLLVSRIGSEKLSEFLDKLKSLNHFIEINSQHILNTPTTTRKSDPLSPHLSGSYIRSEDIMHSEIQRRNQIEVQAQEKLSLCNLRSLIKHTVEVLGLWKVLCDHSFHVVAASLAKDVQSQLRGFTFKDLIVTGGDICNALVTALIHHYLDDNATIDAISGRLREVCPSIFRNEDAVFSKAHEKLVMVKTVQNKAEKETILKEALQLCQEISPQLQLPAVCRLFCSVHYYEGVVNLCLGAAEKRDPQGLAVHFYRNGEPQEDRQGLQAYASRMDCYKAILDTLGHLMSLSASHPQSPSIPKSPGPLPPPVPDTLAPEEGKTYLEMVFKQAIQSQDELFHVALYNWLIDKKLTEKLLEIKTSYLESYLKRNIEQHSDNLSAIDLMWKYYEKNRNFSAAARILLKLAERHSPEVNLQQRLEFLSRAIICVKSSEIRISSSATEGEFLHELEEKMQVARIQLQIAEQLSQKPQSPSVVNALTRLNSDLLDITQLYELFADPFDLYEAKLSIIHCAEHYDPLLVENLWKNIIDTLLQHTVGNRPDLRMMELKNKIVSLGRIYFTSQKYFPVAFLIKHLEFRSCAAQFDIEWVSQTLLAVGVPFQQLLEQYNKLHRLRDPCWRSVRKPHHLLTVLCQLIIHFAVNPKITSQNERRALASHCLDLVASYLVDLQTDSVTDGVPELILRFREVQRKLERSV